MHEAGWDLTWARPVTLALVPDHTDEAALSIRQGSTRIVQITLGSRVRLSITTGTETLEVDGRHPPVEQIHGVLAVHRDDVEIAPDESDLDFDFDETILTLGEEQPNTPHETAKPTLEPDFDATILTPRAGDAGQTADGGRSASAAPSDPAFFFIDLADRNGRVLHRVDGTTLVGRAPRDRDDAGAALLAVSSVTDHVSATHLSLTSSGAHLVVRDLASTNGTTLIPVVGEPYRLTPHEAVPIVPGTRLVLTADVTITVVADPAGSDPVGLDLASPNPAGSDPGAVGAL